MPTFRIHRPKVGGSNEANHAAISVGIAMHNKDYKVISACTAQNLWQRLIRQASLKGYSTVGYVVKAAQWCGIK
jgi:hypothetical protein